MEEPVPVICNVCESRDEGLRGLAYVTSCNHLVCKRCAQDSKGTHCPVCRVSLGEGDIQEVYVGLRSQTDSSIKKSMIEATLASTYWEDVTRNSAQVSEIAVDIVKLIQAQLLFMNAKKHAAGQEDQRRQKAQRDEMEQVHTRAMEQAQTERKLRALLDTQERELADLKLAYKEKMKRCDAWERAYRARTASATSAADRTEIPSKIPLSQAPQLIANVDEHAYDAAPPPLSVSSSSSSSSLYQSALHCQSSYPPTSQSRYPQVEESLPTAVHDLPHSHTFFASDKLEAALDSPALAMKAVIPPTASPRMPSLQPPSKGKGSAFFNYDT